MKQWIKRISFFFLSLIALTTHAQTIQCHTDTLRPGYYKDSVKCYTVITPKLCTDTVGWNYFTSNCHKVKISSKLYSRIRVCDTIKIPITNTRDCSTTYTKCDTLKNYFYFPPVTKISCDTVYPQIEFGAKLQAEPDTAIVGLKALNAKWVRTGMILGTYTGGRLKDVDKFLAAGLKIALNVKWTATTPAPFCRDTTTYAAKYRLLLSAYATEIKQGKIIFICENEPLNVGYYGLDPIENYITLCRLFVRIAGEYGAATADGCSFVEYLNILQTKANYATKLDTKIENQKKLIAAFRTIPFTYLNVHLVIKDDTIPVDMIMKALNYLRDSSGHKLIMTNEYHYENCHSSRDKIKPSRIVFTTTAEWKKGNVVICIVWSGDTINGVLLSGSNSDADGFTNGSILTNLGLDLVEAQKN